MPEYVVRATNLAGLDDFTRSYLECAEWSGIDEDQSEALEAADSPKWSAEAIALAKKDCRAFFSANEMDIGTEHSLAGHDFWLTRNHHGAGFWDGDWPREIGERLTSEAHAYGNVNVTYDEDKEVLYLD